MKRAVYVALFAFAPLVRAAGPTTAPTTRPNIEPFIAQLSDDSWKVRQKAQDQIVAAGDDVVPRLNQILKETKDEEVRARIEAALGQIAANNRNSPTLITLHLKDAPAQTVINEIAHQSRADIGAWPDYIWRNVNQKVTIDADKQPFWSVVKDFCRQTNLAPEPMGGGARNRITLMQRGNAWGNQPTCVQGCYLILAQSAQRTHNIDYSNPGVQTSFSVALRCYIDPKVKIVRGSREVKLEEAVDDKGNSLIVSTQGFENSFTVPWNGNWCWDVSVPLQYRPDQGSKLARLRGAIQFTVLTKADAWEIGDIAKAQNVVKSIPAGKFTVQGMTKNGNGQYSVKIGIELAKEQQGNWNVLTDFSSIQQQIRLMDSSGNSYDCGGGGGGGNGNGQTNYEITFYNSGSRGTLGEPARLVWEIPMEMKDVMVPIEFKDLPLP